MNLNYVLLLLLTMASSSLSANNLRILNFDNQKIEYQVFSKKQNWFQSEQIWSPNLKARIFIVSSKKEIEVLIAKANQDSQANRILNYYLIAPQFENPKKHLEFLEAFVSEIYYRDYINRNSVELWLSTPLYSIECKQLQQLHKVVARVQVSQEDPLLKCGLDLVNSGSIPGTNAWTSKRYDRTTLKEALRSRKTIELTRKLGAWDHNWFMSITVGSPQLSAASKANFDTQTLVDFSTINTAWNFEAGYMFSPRFGGFVSLDYLSKKKETFTDFISFGSGLSVTGSGSGGGLLKAGIGCRYLPYIKDRFSVFVDLSAGSLTAKAGGGTGTAIISVGGTSSQSDLVENQENTNFFDLAIGSNYRLGKVVFLTGNFSYNYSKFENDIGSISGLTGFSVNFGLGISIIPSSDRKKN